ncbi:DUF4334 domain-containing protein [Cyanobium sp. FGCU-52]|nr:DUF4334 domain-containing protein [Cyanobium sp. FGCU52]
MTDPASPTAAPPARDTRAALELFDRLPAVQPAEMLGSWRGESFASGHPLDGILETYHWHGKAFHSEDSVDPLLFRTRGGEVLPLRAVMPDPSWLERWPWLRRQAAGDGFQRWLLPLLNTRAPQARLRLLQHRGISTAAMIYDNLPIVDVFRRLDDQTLLGLMDARGIAQPFFFLLRREEGSGAAQEGAVPKVSRQESGKPSRLVSQGSSSAT